MGINVSSMKFGDIDRTTEAQPDGGIGTFAPQFLTIGFSYAKEFSNSIYGGMSVRMISESINDVKAQGVVVDAGIQYITGFNEVKDCHIEMIMQELISMYFNNNEWNVSRCLHW